MKTFQQAVIENITNLLLNNDVEGGLTGEGFDYIFRAYTDKYGNIYYDKEAKKTITMWWNHLTKKYIPMVRKTILVSKNAVRILSNENIKPAEYKKYLRFEHLTPMSYTKKKLLALKRIDEDTVKECFKYSKVALITKEESNMLDHAGNTYDFADIIAFCMDTKDIQDTKGDALACFSLSPRSNGSGLLRVHYLLNRGVQFVDAENNILTTDKVFEIVCNNDYTVKY